MSTFRVIVSDNADDPSTRAVVAAAADPRVEYVGQPSNLGTGGSYSFLIQGAVGDFVCVLHDDDWYAPTYLEQMVAAFEQFPEAKWGFCNSLRVDEASGHSRLVNPSGPPAVVRIHPGPDAAFDILEGRRQIYFGALMFRTEFAKEMEIDYSFPAAGDRRLCLQLSLENCGVYVPQSLYVYRWWGGNDTVGVTLSGSIFSDNMRILDWIHERPEMAGMDRRLRRVRTRTVRALCIGALLNPGIASGRESCQQLREALRAEGGLLPWFVAEVSRKRNMARAVHAAARGARWIHRRISAGALRRDTRE